MTIFLPAAAAFVGGMLIAYINYLITRAFFIKGKTGLAGVPRSLITALYIACLYFIGAKSDINGTALLIGGALGCTAGAALFTYLLLKENRKGALGEEAARDGRSE